jgi:hypothetical protein
MGGLRRKPVPPGTKDEIVRALARGKASLCARRFRHAGKAYLVFEGGVPDLPPGTIVATGHIVSVIGDGHRPRVDELAAALDAFEGRASKVSSRPERGRR